jgi:hypothetical protein
MSSNFSKTDIENMKAYGISQAEVKRQLEFLKNGITYLDVVAPATPDRGIKVLSSKEQKAAEAAFEGTRRKVMKFVPASGGASRMFKDIFNAEADLEAHKKISGTPGQKFVDNLTRFAFYDQKLFDGKTPLEQIRATLHKPGLNYGDTPKGQVLFHKYETGSRTAFEEHLVEGALYCNQNGVVRMMYTVAPEFLNSFKDLLAKVKPAYEKKYGVKYMIDFSLQKSSTNTLALAEDGKPFRKDNGELLFRPGGHGSLIGNLSGLNADVIILKNIDNVVKESLVSDTVRWKKILAGVLEQEAETVSAYLNRLDACLTPGAQHEDTLALCQEIINFLSFEFCVDVPHVSLDLMPMYLREKLNRPIRVCGMVRNQGEPGGGPFIVRDADGATSLQILESVQLNPNDPKTAKLAASSTHFNPVDLACLITDYKGKKFNLAKYVDTQAGFISSKSFQGRPLTAMERPGLWNGAMSNWNTVFVEVPLSTFNPVKSVLDLLRPEHC